MHDWGTRVEVKDLLDTGLSNSAVARRRGVSWRTVTRWKRGDLLVDEVST